MPARFASGGRESPASKNPHWKFRGLGSTVFRVKTTLLALLLCCCLLAQAHAGNRREVPQTISYCDLARDPLSYNGELILITAFISYGFENFTIADPDCEKLPIQFSVWVTYGGEVNSGAIYCCPGEAGDRTRSQTVGIDGVEIPLKRDAVFERFRQLLENERDTVVRVTVIGRFFARKKRGSGEQAAYTGFGHLGCCSLFVIQQVESFEPHSRADLDHSSDNDWYEDAGCDTAIGKWQRHIAVSEPQKARAALQEQQAADSGSRSWALWDPERVALDALLPIYPGRSPVLKIAKRAPARVVFYWDHDGHRSIVVTTRPYWLSFYSKTEAVAWVATMVKELDCTDDQSDAATAPLQLPRQNRVLISGIETGEYAHGASNGA